MMTRLVPEKLAGTLGDPHLRQLGHLTLVCALIGVVAGLGAAAFYLMLDAGRELFLSFLAGYRPASPGFEKSYFDFGTWMAEEEVLRWVLLLVPALGGLISGLIVFTFAPEAEGHGTDAAIASYHFKDGFVRARVPLIKAITAAITIGSGGSGGREGPIAQIGSGFGSVLASVLKLPPEERRILMAAGMGAGIGAIFHAPLAGALFAAEVMYRGTDFEHEVLVPAFLASIVAYSVFGAIFGFHPLFMTPSYAFDTPATLIPYALLAIVVSAGAMLYVRAFYGVRHLMFERLKRIPNHIKPMIGGLATGVIGFFLPEALGTGYGVLQACFQSRPGVPPDLSGTLSASTVGTLLPAGVGPLWTAALILAAIAVGKIFTTAFSIGSGGSGGVFGPAVAIGGALGAACGLICVRLFPTLPIAPGAFALVGMAGFFAGAANTPVSTIIMVSEMTGNYNLLVPSMMVCVIAFALCQRFNLYEQQLPSRLEAPSKVGGMAIAILRRLTVGEALRLKRAEEIVTVRADANLSEIMEHYAHSTQSCFPVVDREGHVTGVIDAADLRRIIRETSMGDLIIARDIEVPAVRLTADDSLLAAVNTMVRFDRNEVVVVDKKDPDHILGTLARGDIIAAYNRQLIEAGSATPA